MPYNQSVFASPARFQSEPHGSAPYRWHRRFPRFALKCGCKCGSMVQRANLQSPRTTVLCLRNGCVSEMVTAGIALRGSPRVEGSKAQYLAE